MRGNRHLGRKEWREREYIYKWGLKNACLGGVLSSEQLCSREEGHTLRHTNTDSHLSFHSYLQRHLLHSWSWKESLTEDGAGCRASRPASPKKTPLQAFPEPPLQKQICSQRAYRPSLQVPCLPSWDKKRTLPKMPASRDRPSFRSPGETETSPLPSSVPISALCRPAAELEPREPQTTRILGAQLGART